MMYIQSDMYRPQLMAGVELPTEQTQERKKSGIFFLWCYYHKKCVYSISQLSPQPLHTQDKTATSLAVGVLEKS